MSNRILYNRSQRIGIVLLIVLLAVFISFRYGAFVFFKSVAFKPDSILIAQTDSMEIVIQQMSDYVPYLNKEENSEIKWLLKPFNPNTVDSIDLVNMGFPRKIISNIINYRKSGGKFNCKHDVKKLYNVDECVYKKMSSFIELPDSFYFFKVNNTLLNQESILVGLNLSGSKELKSINGIGEVLSKRIIKYRDLLGGFYSVKQLTDVYGIDSNLYTKIEKRFFIDSQIIIKKDINEIDFKGLASHPYVTGYNAKTIFKYRTMREHIDSLQELYDFKILSKKELERFSEYFYVKK